MSVLRGERELSATWPGRDTADSWLQTDFLGISEGKEHIGGVAVAPKEGHAWATRLSTAFCSKETTYPRGKALDCNSGDLSSIPVPATVLLAERYTSVFLSAEAGLPLLQSALMHPDEQLPTQGRTQYRYEKAARSPEVQQHRASLQC